MHKPSYTLLASYEGLFQKGSGFTSFYRDGGLLDTISLIKKATEISRPQVADLARHLNAGEFYQSCFNIWHFITENVKYKLDDPGTEQVRTASRSWADRYTGVDCEDYAILAASLLLNMGYTPVFEIVAFNGHDQFSHIFCVAHDGARECVIDPTPNPGQGPVPFNTRPFGITNTMKEYLLEGVPAAVAGGAIEGLGCVAPATDRTQMFKRMQSSVISMHGLGQIDDISASDELTKIRYGIMLNGTPDQAVYSDVVYEHLVGIDSDGEFIYKPGIDLDLLDQMVYAHQKAQNLGLVDPLMQDVFPHLEGTPMGLQGLGNWLSDAAKKVKNAAKSVIKKVENNALVKKVTSVKNKAVTLVKRGAKWVGSKAGKAFHALMKINPVFVAIRNAFLLSLRVNFLHMSERLKWGYLSPEEAAKRGFNMAEHAKLRDKVARVENIFYGFGGEKKNIKNVVLLGGKGLNGLGEPVTMASVVAASGVIAATVKLLKDIDFKKLMPPGKEGEAPPEVEDSELQQTEEMKARPSANTYANDEEKRAAEDILDKGAKGKAFEEETSTGSDRVIAPKNTSPTVSIPWVPILLGAGVLVFALKS